MAKTNFLSFEQSIAELDAKLQELRFVQDDSAVDISEEISRLMKKSKQLTKDIYSRLTPWQVSQIARHPNRPYTLDYINEIFTDFHELHGDRAFADDPAIVGGLAVSMAFHVLSWGTRKAVTSRNGVSAISGCRVRKGIARHCA